MLSAFLDGRIVESEKRLLEEHLESCVECDARYADLVAVRTALRAAQIGRAHV
jgi:anti-sigma factor RsiW